MKSKLFICSLPVFAGLVLFSCSNGDNANSAVNEDTVMQVQVMPGNEAVKPAGARYGIKSGIVTFEPYEIMGMKITQTTYFDDYGGSETQEIVTQGEIMGVKTKNHKVTIIKDGYSINYDIENFVNGVDQAKKIAHKSKILGLTGNINFAELTDELKKRFDYKEEGSETVAGVEGTKFSMTIDNNKSKRISGVIYKNVILKSEASMGGIDIMLKASSFETGADIPGEKFEVPEGYTIKEI